MRFGSNDQNNKKPQNHYMGICIALGAGIGTALGAGIGAIFDMFPITIGIGTAVGAGMGVAIGAAFDQEKQKDE